MSAQIDRFPKQQKHFGESDKVGVLLVNLGTPEGHDVRSVRRYLAEFLSDSRVIELSKWLWLPVLHGIILRTRPGRVSEAYRKVWLDDSDESPLRYHTRRQAESLPEHLGEDGNTVIAWAMRYGNPSIAEGLSRLQDEGCQRILVAPLYPQYSATTTAAVNDTVFDFLKSLRWQPAIRCLPEYYSHPAYIEALAESIEKYIGGLAKRPDRLIASFHGLPQEYIDKGDPYYDQCLETIRCLRKRLYLTDDYLLMTFQSRFGPKQWLQPYTDQVLISLAKAGVKHVAIITPGFSADCLETLEEMGMQNREIFLNNGGERYDLLACLNDSKIGLRMLATLIRQELSGWS